MSDSIRMKWFRCLNEPSARYWPSVFVTSLISLVIILNIVEVILSSMQGYTLIAGEGVLYFSYGFALFFTLEYALRIWVAAEASSGHYTAAWKKRWHYIVSPMGLVDLLSSLPLLIWVILPTEQFADFRILKLISMVRVFKLTRYSGSLSMLARVYSENQQTLFAAAFVMIILMVLSATGIYIFERHVQPEDFGSIPSSMWWAFVTLTTVGYGDVTPITLGGKIFGSVVMVCGVGVAAMPAGIFASSFVRLVKEQEHERRLTNRFRRSAINMPNKPTLRDAEYHLSHLNLTKSEQNEVKYLVEEYHLTVEQAVGVVGHFRHGV